MEGGSMPGGAAVAHQLEEAAVAHQVEGKHSRRR